MKSIPESVFVELMKTTMTLSQNLGINPFDIFDREIDEVILMINFYIELGKENQATVTSQHKEERIRVNDKTATGGWF